MFDVEYGNDAIGESMRLGRLRNGFLSGLHHGKGLQALMGEG